MGEPRDSEEREPANARVHQHRRVRCALRALLGSSVLALVACVGANVIVFREGSRRIHGGRQVHDADAIVVLGARIYADGSPSEILVDRLQTALELWRDGKAPRIVVSGDHGGIGYDEPAAMRRWLIGHGLPASAILSDDAGLDTYSSMWRGRHVFHLERAIVVTQAFHLPRALYVGAHVGLDVEGVAADRRAYKGALLFGARELLSRPKAWIDVLRGRTPRHAD